MNSIASGTVLQIALLLAVGCSRSINVASGHVSDDEQVANAAYERLYNESVVRSNGFENVMLTRLKAVHQEFERRQKERDPAAAKWFREQMDQMSPRETGGP